MMMVSLYIIGPLPLLLDGIQDLIEGGLFHGPLCQELKKLKCSLSCSNTHTQSRMDIKGVKEGRSRKKLKKER